MTTCFFIYSCHFLGSNLKSFTLNCKVLRYGSNFFSKIILYKDSSCATTGFSHAITITPPGSIENGRDFFLNFSGKILSQKLKRFVLATAFLNCGLSIIDSIMESTPSKSVYKTLPKNPPNLTDVFIDSL